MTMLLDWLTQSCQDLELNIEKNFSIKLNNGHILKAIARIPNIGARNGMLLFSSYDEIESYLLEIEKLGYGYSILEAPRISEAYDLTSFMEMYRDWGWSGNLENMPYWFN